MDVEGFWYAATISSYFLSLLSLISLLNYGWDFMASISCANDSNFIKFKCPFIITKTLIIFNLLASFYNFMNITMLRLTLLSLLIIFTLSIDDSNLYKKYLNTIDPEAKCLDGTPGLLYTHEGG
jgi:hypothetical protein